MVSVVRRMNEVTVRRSRLVLGWVTVCEQGYNMSHVTNQLGQLSFASLYCYTRLVKKRSRNGGTKQTVSHIVLLSLVVRRVSCRCYYIISAHLKLRPYGPMQIRLLVLLLFFYTPGSIDPRG